MKLREDRRPNRTATVFILLAAAVLVAGGIFLVYFLSDSVPAAAAGAFVLAGTATAAINHLVPELLGKITRGLQVPTYLNIAVELNPMKISSFSDDSLDYLLPRTADLTSPPGSDEDFYALCSSAGGVPVGRSRFRISLEGASPDGTVLLTGLRARILARDKLPECGFPVRRPSAGEVDVRHVHIDLDDAEPVARWSRTPGGTRKGINFALAKGEVEVLDIVATASRDLISWEVQLNYVANGKNGSAVVPVGTMQTAGVQPQRWYEWLPGCWSEVGADEGVLAVECKDPTPVALV